MKKLLILCILLITVITLSFGQAPTGISLEATRLKITNEDYFFVVNKNSSPVTINIGSTEVKVNKESFINLNSTKTMFVDKSYKETYYFFTETFISATAYYDAENVLIRFSLLDVEGSSFTYFNEEFRL